MNAFDGVCLFNLPWRRICAANSVCGRRIYAATIWSIRRDYGRQSRTEGKGLLFQKLWNGLPWNSTGRCKQSFCTYVTNLVTKKLTDLAMNLCNCTKVSIVIQRCAQSIQCTTGVFCEILYPWSKLNWMHYLLSLLGVNFISFNIERVKNSWKMQIHYHWAVKPSPLKFALNHTSTILLHLHVLLAVSS